MDKKDVILKDYSIYNDAKIQMVYYDEKKLIGPIIFSFIIFFSEVPQTVASHLER